MKAKPAMAALATLALVLASVVAADTNPPVQPGDESAPTEVVRWNFSYSGPRVTARGVLETAAVPEPDGSYRIVSIIGKRNGKRIVELVPAGEIVTAHTMLFGDNRLLPASPFVGDGGFSFRTSNKEYFNVCHAVEEGHCGWKGYREYDGKRAGRPIRLELTRVTEPVPPTPPAPRVATELN